MWKLLSVLVLSLAIPMAANALSIDQGSGSRAVSVFKMVTSDGYFVRFDVNSEGKVVKGKVSGQGLRCTIIQGGSLRRDGKSLYGKVYYTCGTLDILKMFGVEPNWNSVITGGFGVSMSGNSYSR